MYQKLKDAYRKARYSRHHKVSREELDWLSDRAEVLGQRVHEICSRRIAALEAKAPGHSFSASVRQPIVTGTDETRNWARSKRSGDRAAIPKGGAEAPLLSPVQSLKIHQRLEASFHSAKDTNAAI